MAQVSLTNQVDITGQYGDGATPISFSSNVVTTSIIQGLTINKTADKVNWIDGPLTYTIVVQNDSGSTLSSGVLTDNLNTDLIEFSQDYGVKIDNTSSSEYTYSNGELKITLPSLADQQSTTITFQVTRKT